jgi:outer membrane protein assembly factor BamA
MNTLVLRYIHVTNRSLILIVVLSVCFTFTTRIEGNELVCDQTTNVIFIINDIFQLPEADTIFLHDWANFLHIKTKQKTLINEAAFFLKKCQLDSEDLLELERHLRAKKYIRDASVKFTQDNKVVVETWDNWSLAPTLDFGRKGGVNKSAVGIKDRNLFGLGIDAEIEYFKNDQRTGYKLDTQFPLFLNNNTSASIRLTNNDDGNSKAAFMQKKFVSFDTEYAYEIGFDNFSQVDTQYEGGVELNQYIHDKRLSTASWQWLQNNTFNETLRFGIGYTSERHSFSDVIEPKGIYTSVIPIDRDFSYPFFRLHYLQKDYRKLKNFNLINQIEDFNLGWDVKADLGTSVTSDLISPQLIFRSKVSKGVDLSDKSLLFFNAEIAGELYSNNENKERYLLSLNSEFFSKINENWGGYIKNTSQFSKNQFIDSPVVLGGETGIRGFPLQYQRGRNSTLFTLEARYYPHINLYKLIELGGAFFIDTGKVFGRSELSNNQSSWITSIGLGARFYSTHSSEGQVVHFDIVKPISSDPNVSDIEYRLTTKHSF